MLNVESKKGNIRIWKLPSFEDEFETSNGIGAPVLDRQFVHGSLFKLSTIDF